MKKRKIGWISAFAVMMTMLFAGCGDSPSGTGGSPAATTAACSHQWKEATCTDPKTCSLCGATDGQALGHNFEGETCVKDGVCSRCGEKQKAKGHQWTDATCTTAKTCSICGETTGEPLGHTTNAGVCDRCGEVITSKVEVYSDDKVTIYFRAADYTGVYFEVENHTDATITIQADSVSVNGKSTGDILMSDEVAPQSSGIVSAQCSIDYGKSVGTVGGQLRIIDFKKSFKSYDAKFSNVVVDESVDIASTASGALLYEDKRVRISFNSLNSNGVSFDVENLTDASITIQADSISINGRSTNDIMMSDDVAPQSIGTVTAQCYFDPNTKVGTVGGQLRIIDFNSSFKSYDAIMDNIVVDENVTVSPVPEGTLVFEDSKVKIYFKEVDQGGVVFDVENLTGASITIQADSVSVNKKSTDDIMMSDDVAPHSIGEVVAQCSVSYEGAVTSVGGQLRIIDFNNSFKSYDAKFINVPIEN